jgi:hypothetical protein
MHKSNFYKQSVILTRMSVILFDTTSVISTRTNVITSTSVISIRKRLISALKVRFLHGESDLQPECGF